MALIGTRAPAAEGAEDCETPGQVGPWQPMGAVPWRWGYGRFGWVWGGIWLAYLLDPIARIWHLPVLWKRGLALGALMGFAAVFLVAFTLRRNARRRGRTRVPPLLAAAAILGMIAFAVPVIVIAGQNALGMTVYVVVLVMFLLPTRQAWLVAALIAAAAVVVPRMLAGWQVGASFAFQVFLAALAMWGVTALITRNAELAAAREEIARLAVADERARFARDMHDLLGHSLTVISVKAELAGRLVALSPERAEAELADVQRLARQALRDVRTAVAGYRQLDLGQELKSARSALAAAGIAADLPETVGELPTTTGELFAWAVREGVTNVVRHSGARHCRIRIDAHEVEVTDDGRGPVADGGTAPGPGDPDRVLAPDPAGPELPVPGGPPGAPGHGLTGLRERATALGGSVIVDRPAAGGFALRVHVP